MELRLSEEGEGRGVLLYLMQEGRGAGLLAKARDRMMVQAHGERISTFDAFDRMGLPRDRRKLESARERMHELMKQDQPDEMVIMQQADTLGQLQTEAHKSVLHTLLQVRALLTPEQRTQLEDLMPRGSGARHHRGDDGNG